MNIPPVLLVEILGDLKNAENEESCQREVQVLAEKLVPACSAVNTPFRELIVSEFRGQTIAMDGRPILTGGQHVNTEGGEAGVIFDEAPEDAALLRWQAGEFKEAEALMAEAWRRSTLSVDLEGLQSRLRSQYSPRLKLRSLEATAEFVDDLMASADPQLLVGWFVRDIALTPTHQGEVIDHVNAPRFRSLQISTPYTYFCLRAALVFHFALAFGLVSTRPTNRVDLEYLYYTPFCNAFSSGDKFHRETARFFLTEQQVFIERDELKADFKQLSVWWSALDEKQKDFESGRSGPPENENSVTHKLWRALMKPGYRDRERLDRTLSPEALKRIGEHVSGLIKTGEPSGKPVGGSLEDFNFVARKHFVRLDGPCICGSEKLFRECCHLRSTEQP